MKCQHCRAPNREGRKFCATCGASLTSGCLDCGFANQPGENFCGGCGKPLAEDTSVLHKTPQRRRLTVMFCDLVGSTALSHHLDPEDLREVIRAYQKCVARVVARYGGFISRYMGDGVLVLFGYPQALENGAARAIYSALEIITAVEELSPTSTIVLRVRIGIATGLVVVGDIIGEGASEEAAVVGETPNLAARLQALAEPGSVMISEATRDLAGGLFQHESAGPFDIKGFPTPVSAWRVLRQSAADGRIDADGKRRLTPLVGRHEELDKVLKLWQLAMSGQGQIVSLVGDAGIGKSRLTEEVAQLISRDSHSRLRIQCSLYHTNSALYPFIRQLEREAGFSTRDGALDKLEKLERMLAGSFQHLDEIAPLFAMLLSLPIGARYPALRLTPREQNRRTLEALILRLESLAKRGPLVVEIEDLHWIDPTSAELLNLAADRIARIPVLVMLTSRVATNYPWLGRSHVHQIHLKRLEPRQSEMIVGRVLAGRTIPRELITQIVERTDGVPLFIEEVTKTLVTSVTEVPSTLHDSLMARLDQLGSAKEIAQMAAVIGREFSRDLLTAIAPWDQQEIDEALDKLVTSEVVFGRGHSPFKAFVFKHALIEDAAYASLLRSRRQDLHLAVAQALEQLYPDRVRTEPEIVAHHYTQARKAIEGATYWAAAAQRALDRTANLETLGHATKGIDTLSGALPSTERSRLEADLEMLRGAAHRASQGFASGEAERSFARAHEICQQLTDVPRLIETHRGLFSFHYARGQLDAARQQGSEVAALGHSQDGPALRMLGHWMSGCVLFWQGDFVTARRNLEAASLLYDAVTPRTMALAQQIDLGVNAKFHYGWLLWFLGHSEQADDVSEQAIATARRLAQPFALAMAIFFACAMRVSSGRGATVRKLGEELQQLAAQHGLSWMAACALVIEAQCLIENGQCQAGVDLVKRAIREFRDQHSGIGLPWIKSVAVAGYLKQGLASEGLSMLEDAMAAVAHNGERQWLAELHRLRGELLLLEPRQHLTDAEAAFREAIEVARRQGTKPLEIRAAISLARLLVDRGERAAAYELLAPTYAGFIEDMDCTDLCRARMILDQLKSA